MQTKPSTKTEFAASAPDGILREDPSCQHVYSPLPPPGAPLRASFFQRDTLQVATDLLGKLVVRGEPEGFRWGRLVEVEAYLGPEDRAAHSWHGLTERTRPMFEDGGRAYVYLVYGVHHCLNFVTREAGCPQAVLVRALEPLVGLARCSGPGLVARSLSLDRSWSGRPLEPPELYLVDDGVRPGAIFQTPRIGVGYADEWAERPWRFAVASPHLSRRLARVAPGPLQPWNDAVSPK